MSQELIINIIGITIAGYIIFQLYKLFRGSKVTKPECDNCDLKESCSKTPGQNTAKGYVYPESIKN